VWAGLIVYQPVARGQSQGWSLPISLSLGWFPDVVADLTGQVHVVWSSTTLFSIAPSFDTVMYTTSRDGKDWSEINDIAAMRQVTGVEATRPTIIVDLTNTLHLTFRLNDTRVYYAHAQAESAASAAAWRATQPVSSGAQVAYFSRVAVDHQGLLHLAYTENITNRSCLICYHVFYRRSDDRGQTWSEAVDISRSPIGSAKPQIVVDSQDDLHLVWEAGPGGSYGSVTSPTTVMYAASYDRGTTWSTPVEFTAPNNQEGKNVTIGLDGQGQLVVAWLALPEMVVYYQTSADQGRSWSTPRVIPGVFSAWSIYKSALDDYAMATDSAGNVHFVMVGQTAEGQTSLSVLHLVWNGSGWSPPEAITTLTGDVPEWPRIAIGLGNQLHVVWFVRDGAHIFDSDRGQYQIWYSRGTASAPASPPILLPTTIPTPVPTAIPNLAGATSVASARPTLTSSGASDTYKETDGIIVLLQSLVPAVLIIVLVIVGLRLWRR